VQTSDWAKEIQGQRTIEGKQESENMKPGRKVKIGARD
jgi:hypothetical protein